jgi:serine protease Do
MSSRTSMKCRWRLAASLLASALYLSATQALGTATLPDFASYTSSEEAVVVSISTVSLPRRRAVDDEVPPSDDDLPSSPSPIGDSVARHAVRGLASGFIIGSDGHILTSAHVVTGIGAMTVRLADGREFVGKVIGADVLSDVALVKIDADGLPVAPVGDPGKVGVGDWVSAIGAPFGLETSVTAGIVSAKRLLPGSGGILFLQTDVAVNPGSSGSPLFNLRGQVIGINSMVYTTSGGYQGVSFALPIDVAIRIAGQLRASGRVVRGQLGMSVQEVTPGLAQAFGLQRPAGALVARVARGSTAEVADMRVGDIVLGIGRDAELSYAEIQRRVEEQPPGTTLALVVWRDRALRRVDVAVGAHVAKRPAAAPDSRQGDRLGIVLAQVQSPAGASGEGGVLEVREAHGMALRAGISVGDRILSVNGTAVQRIAEYEAALAKLPTHDYVALLVLRDGGVHFFALGASSGAR